MGEDSHLPCTDALNFTCLQFYCLDPVRMPLVQVVESDDGVDLLEDEKHGEFVEILGGCDNILLHRFLFLRTQRCINHFSGKHAGKDYFRVCNSHPYRWMGEVS